uniref:Ras-associating domain-containing protein n=1 Tax=Panagrolaimus superbus TaxID=310955 RepID=A0A914Y5N2_9BILA
MLAFIGVGNTSSASADSSQTDELSRNSKRFSKRKKEKELRKKYQNQKQVIENDIMKQREEDQQVSRRLYDEVPPTTFTRTISNPEAVMKKRREQKIENRLRQISKGGSVKIFSGDLDPSRPYVTLLVGAEDRAYKIIRDTLIKLGGEFDKALPDDFCLIEVSE